MSCISSGIFAGRDFGSPRQLEHCKCPVSYAAASELEQ
jgi:hypothetical protein